MVGFVAIRDEKTVMVKVKNLEETADLTHFLVVVEGPREGQWIEVPKKGMVIGRGESADLDLGDRAVSSRHCKVRIDWDQLVVEDLGSMNGTFVNGRPLREPRKLRVGGRLQLGRSLLKYELRSRDEVQQQEELTAELEKAAGYVRSLLPEPLDTEVLTTEWRLIPCAQLGGDAFGYDWLDEDRFALYLIDACGHGTRSALHSVSVINDLRKQALRKVDFTQPEQVLTALNRSFKMEEHGGMYFTIWYGIYRPSRRQLSFSAAGHPPGLLVDKDREVVGRLATAYPGIGLFENIDYEATQVEIPAGSRLYLYSDGAYEVRTRDGEEWTLEEFLEVLGGPSFGSGGDLDRIEQAVREQMATELFEDDFSLLITEFH